MKARGYVTIGFNNAQDLQKILGIARIKSVISGLEFKVVAMDKPQYVWFSMYWTVLAEVEAVEFSSKYNLPPGIQFLNDDLPHLRIYNDVCLTGGIGPGPLPFVPVQGANTMPSWNIEELKLWPKVIGLVCECGADKHGFASHSNWCKKA